MQFVKKEVGKVLVLEISGEIMGGAETEGFKSALYEAIQKDMTNVVADMTRVTWMNSSGLGMLISGLTTLRSSGGDLRLANLSEKIKRPLVITRLDTVFQTYNSVQEAIDSYQ